MEILLEKLRNIQRKLEKRNIKPVDMPKEIDVSKQTMNKMMDGIRTINAIELHKIVEYLIV